MPTRAGAQGIPFPRDPYLIALFLLTVVTVSRVHQHYGFLVALRPGLLLTAVAVGVAILSPRLTKSENLARWPARVMMALGLVACLSAPFGISLGGSASYILEDYSKVLVYGFLLVVAMRSARELSMLVWAYVIACGLLAWMANFVFGLSAESGSATARLNDMYSYDANDLGCVLLVGFPLTLLAMQVAGTRGRVLAMCILYGIGASIARSGSRGALVGLVAVVVVVLFMLRQVSAAKRIGFVGVLAVGLVVTAPPGYWAQMKTILEPTDDYNWTARDGRKEVAKRGMRYMVTYPVFGLGINNFGRAEGTISTKARRHVEGEAGIRWTAAHNTWVQVGAELGITGLLLWCGLIFGGMVSALRLRRRMPAHWARGDPEERFLHLACLYVPLALVGFAVSSTFVSFAYVDPIYIVAAYLVGLHVAVERKLAESASAPTSAPALASGATMVTPVAAGRRAGARVAPFVPTWGANRNT